MAEYQPHDHDHDHTGRMTRNGYEREAGTVMLATTCLICGRPLRDPESIERGVGPYCAQKHGMLAPTGAPDAAAYQAALATAPALMRESVEQRGGLRDPRQALSAAIHAAGSAWERQQSDATHYIGSAMELATALGYDGTAKALRRVFIEGWKYDEDGNPIEQGRPRGIVVKESAPSRTGQAGWELMLPYLDRNLWSQTKASLKAAGVITYKDQRGAWHDVFPATERQWLLVLNALVATLAGTLGVLPSGETFMVPSERLPVPEPESVRAPEGAGPERAVEQGPGRLPKDASELETGDTVYLKGKPMVVAWISPDRVRTILLTPENAALSMKEKGFLHGKAYGGVTAGMRDVSVTSPDAAEVTSVEQTTDKPVTRAAESRDLPETFFPHQREGALWLLQQGSGLLAYDMGLGKTGVGLVAADAPVLVVCPKSLKENWVRETAKWRPDLTAVRIETGKRREEKSLEAASRADVVVVNYDILKRYIEPFRARGFKTLILDESHYIKNFRYGPRKDPNTGRWNDEPTGSDRAVAAWEVAQSIPRRICLTGTPMDNKSPCEMFGQLHLVAPDEFPKFKPFGESYCDPQEVIGPGGKTIMTYEGASNLLGLHERINGKFMLRRTKELLDLPEKWRQTKYLSLDEATTKEYARAAKDLFAYIHSRGGWAAMKRAERAEVLVRMSTLSHLTGVGKIEGVLEQAQQHWEGTHRPLLIFAQHADVQEALLAGLQALNYRVGAIGGGMSEKQRQDVVDRFQRGVPESASPEQREYYDILVLSLTSAREGLTLTRAQDVWFAERTWSPQHLAQAEDRAHRIGQKNQVTAVYWDAPGTLDEALGRMLSAKVAVAGGVLAGVSMTQEEVAAEVFGSLMTANSASRATDVQSLPEWADPE